MIDRQSVIEKAINVEHLISVLITHKFFPGDVFNVTFLKQVMYDPSANTGFKVSVFSKCYPDVPKVSTERIRRIFNIRNIFAHCGPDALAFVDTDRSELFEPERHFEPLDFAALEHEFFELEALVHKELLELIEAAGVPEFDSRGIEP